jgi:hypothetical protein
MNWQRIPVLHVPSPPAIADYTRDAAAASGCPAPDLAMEGRTACGDSPTVLVAFALDPVLSPSSGLTCWCRRLHRSTLDEAVPDQRSAEAQVRLKATRHTTRVAPGLIRPLA